MKNLKKIPVKAVIASDQQLVAEGLQSLMNSSGNYRILKIFGDDDSLFNYIQHHPIDLLLLDLNFTGADGFQLCRKIKKRYPAIKIAVVTAFGGDKTVHQARKSFVDGFFTKG